MYTQNDKEGTYRVLCFQPRLQKWSRKPVGTVVSLLGDWARNSPAHAQSSNANHAPLIVNSVQLAEQSGSHGVGGATVIAVNPAEIAEKSGERKQLLKTHNLLQKIVKERLQKTRLIREGFTHCLR